MVGKIIEKNMNILWCLYYYGVCIMVFVHNSIKTLVTTTYLNIAIFI